MEFKDFPAKQITRVRMKEKTMKVDAEEKDKGADIQEDGDTILSMYGACATLTEPVESLHRFSRVGGYNDVNLRNEEILL